MNRASEKQLQNVKTEDIVESKEETVENNTIYTRVPIKIEEEEGEETQNKDSPTPVEVEDTEQDFQDNLLHILEEPTNLERKRIKVPNSWKLYRYLKDKKLQEALLKKYRRIVFGFPKREHYPKGLDGYIEFSLKIHNGQKHWENWLKEYYQLNNLHLEKIHNIADIHLKPEHNG